MHNINFNALKGAKHRRLTMKCSTEFTVGIDLGDKNHEICMLDKEGEKVLRKSIKNNAKAINEFFDQFEDQSKVLVAIETGTHSPWISHLLEGRGFKVLVGNSRELRIIWDTPNKNDKRDAEMLARIARFDPKLLKPVQHRNMQSHMDLAVLKARDHLVRTRSKLITSVRGLVKSVGARLSKCSTASFSQQVAKQIPDGLRPALLPLLATIAGLNKLISEYDSQIAKLAKERYPETEKVQQIQGVGPVTALGFILTLENPDRFRKSRDVGPYIGLTPKRDQSGETDKQLSITKHGNQYMRRLLVNAANYILGHFGPDCDLRRYGLRIMGDGTNKIRKRKAKVAVARKVAVVLHHLWKSGDVYDPFFNTKKKKIKQAA